MYQNNIYKECPRCGKKGECCYLCHDCMQDLSGDGFKLQREFYDNGCTIVIPTWNCEDTIVRCLKSISKAFPNGVKLEIIFIDKESTDATIDDIDFIMSTEELSKIPYRIMTETGKLGKARLEGIEHAKYKTIFWLDSDIVLPENYIDKLFAYVERLHDNKKIPLLTNIYGLQGWMDCRDGTDKKKELWHKWWNGFERGNFNKYGYNLGCPTANLLVLNDYKLTFKEKQELSELSSQEDNYLGKKVRSMGYEMYVMDIPTLHLKFDQKRAKDNQDYEILWLLVGEKGIHGSKIKALWHFKWVLFRGLRAWQIYPELKLLKLTLKIYLNAIRAVLIKDEKIVSQERLTELKDW